MAGKAAAATGEAGTQVPIAGLVHMAVSVVLLSSAWPLTKLALMQGTTPLWFAEARAVSKFAQDLFLKGEADSVDILFTQFISTLVQQPKTIPFLPVGKIKAVTVGIPAPEPELAGAGVRTDSFEFEPDEKTVLGMLLPHSLNFQMHQILLETKASEQSARMVAMKNATDNAKQIIKDLTLEYNKLRQANITKELLEITTAQMAVG